MTSEGLCCVGQRAARPGLQGIGTQRMRQIGRELPRTRKFELFTGSRSVGNIRLYERLGYVRAREEPLSPANTLGFRRNFDDHPHHSARVTP
jgi:hypothetical protein